METPLDVACKTTRIQPRRSPGRCAWLLLGALTASGPALAADPPDIGSRLELFVDRFLVERVDGARLQLHQPRPAGVAISFDKPWEGRYCGYATVIKDGALYRMYYRGLPDEEQNAPAVTCYAESPDGVRWTKPNLGLHAVNGTRDNNVILTPEMAGDATHDFSPFLDTKPGVAPEQRFKALGGVSAGLYGFASADGIHWNRIGESPLVTGGAFDSQNVAFWSAGEGQYVCYYRTWINGIRRISRQTSPDFIHWSGAVDMGYGGAAIEHLYTNQTSPYFRAPHIYIATAARLMPGRRVLTDQQAADLGLEPAHWLVGDCSDGVLLSTRGGGQYDRTFPEGFIRPGTGYANWLSRTNYPALGVVPTGTAEMSLYVQRGYGMPGHHLERLTLRTDGFASVQASSGGGEMVTRPFLFTGRELVINYATSAAGSVRVEVQDAAGQPVNGFTLADADEIIGDEIERVVTWRGKGDVSSLARKPVRLRFVLGDADLYSFRFRQPAPANDLCTGAVTIGAGTIAGATTGAAAELVDACGSGPDVWYRYTAAGKGTVTLESCAGDAPVAVAIYPDNCASPAALACGSGCGAPGCASASCLTLAVSQGVSYLVRVSSPSGTGGDFSLRLTENLPTSILPEGIAVASNGSLVWFDEGFENDTVGAAPGPPNLGQLAAGSGVSVVNDAVPGPASGARYIRVLRGGSGQPTLRLQFPALSSGKISASFAFNSPVTGYPQISLQAPAGLTWPSSYRQLLTINMPSPGAISIYDGQKHAPTGLSIVPGQWNRVRFDHVIGSNMMTLSINGMSASVPVWQPGVIASLFFETGGPGTTYYLDGVRHAADECGDAPPIQLGAVASSNAQATTGPQTGCDGENDVWFAFTAPVKGTFTFTTCGSGLDTVLSLFDACGGAARACNDNCSDAGCGGIQSCIHHPLNEGQRVLVRVAGAAGARGEFTLNIIPPLLPPPPVKPLDPILKTTWHIGPDLPIGFQDSEGGIIDDVLVSAGGFCAGETVPSKPGKYPAGFFKNVWGLELNNRANGWFAIPDFPGDARQELFGATVANQVYLWGGFSYSAPFAYRDGWRLSRKLGNWVWEGLPDLPFSAAGSGMAAIGNRIYASGGADYDLNSYYTATDRAGGTVNLGSRLLVLDTTRLAAGWQRLPDCPGTPRWVHAFTAVDGKLYVIGGATGGPPFCTVVDNWAFDTAAGAWSRLPDLPISTGNFPSGSNIVFQDRYILLVGGYQYGCAFSDRTPIVPYGPVAKSSQPNTVYNADMFVYDTVAEIFGRTDNLPLNNNLPMAMLQGDELYLIGGETGGSWLTDTPAGAVYDPNGEYFGHHPDLCLIGKLEVLTVPSDYDGDRDVDQRDLSVFRACLTGPGVPYNPASLPAGCGLTATGGKIPADLDADGDVDQADFGAFQACITGPNAPVRLACGQHF